MPGAFNRDGDDTNSGFARPGGAKAEALRSYVDGYLAESHIIQPTSERRRVNQYHRVSNM